jgi:hypothetical protein
MPKLPTRWDLGDPTNNLRRGIRISGFGGAANALGNVSRYTQQAADAKGRAADSLSQGLTQLGNKITTEGDKYDAAVKASSKKGGGSGGSSGDPARAPDQPIKDEDGNVIGWKDGAPMTADEAYRSDIAADGEQKRALITYGHENDDATVGNDEHANAWLSERFAKSERRRAAIHNSPYLKDSQKNKLINDSLKREENLRTSLLKLRTERGSAAATSEASDTTYNEIAPQVAGAASAAEAQEIFTKGVAVIRNDKRFAGEAAIDSANTMRLESATSYLEGHLSYQDGKDFLDGKYKGDVEIPKFVQNLNREGRAEVKKKLEARETEFNSNVKRKLGQLKLRHEGGDDVDDGEDAAMDAAVLKTNDPDVQQAYAEYKLQRSARSSQRGKKLSELEGERAARAKEVDSGKLSKEKAAATQKEVQVLDTAIANAKKDRSKGGLEYSFNNRIIPRTELNTATLQGLAETIGPRLASAVSSANANPDLPMDFTVGTEPAELLKLFRKNPKKFVALITQVPGLPANEFFQNLDDKLSNDGASALVVTGRLLTSDPSSAAASSYLAYQERRANHATKGTARTLSLPWKQADGDGDRNDRRSVAQKHLGAVIRGGDQLARYVEYADSVMAERIESGEYSEGWDEDLYEKVLDEVAGGKMVNIKGEGKVKFGGIGTQSPYETGFGGTVGFHDEEIKTIVPDDVRADKFKEVMDSVPFAQWPDGVPVDANGLPFDESWKDYIAYVEVSEGKYKVAKFDGESWSYLQNPKTEKNYVLDWAYMKPRALATKKVDNYVQR